MQLVPALNFQCIATQFIEARYRPDVGRNAEVLHQNIGGAEYLAQNRARAHQLRPYLALTANLQQVHAAQDAVLNALRHRWVHIVLVHRRDVVENVFLLADHAPQPVLDDDGQLIGIGWVVGHTVRNRRCVNEAVAILVLQALACERGSAGSSADQEAARLLVAAGPDEIADALEAEHRVIDVKRHHLFVVIGVRRACRKPGAERATFIDAFFEDLAFLVLAVVHQLTGIFGLVQLPFRRIDTELSEHALHAERTRFIRHDWNDTVADLLVACQRGQHAYKCHRRRCFAFARTVELRLENLESRYR